jgi:cell division transport system permease protein
MATAGKSSSLKRSSPSYINSIVGVALVLFMMGIMGWVFLNAKQVSTVFKEKIPVSAYLRTLNKDTIGTIQKYIASQPYSKEVVYTDKAKAKEIYNKENNENWDKVLNENPLPESIDFFVKAEYVNKDSMQNIVSDITKLFGNQITEIQYQPSLVSQLDNNASKIGLIFLVIATILCIIVIFSIDNTIRLAMFSNRFLIKTMQMVGATRGFIAKPMNIRAVVNGLISGAVAVGLLFTLIGWAESQFPELQHIRDTKLTLTLFGGMVIIGVLISWFSTQRSVMKYLKMRLDDLY